MAKMLAYNDEARQKLASGVSKLARAVRSTLGPRGRNAVIDKGWGSPTVTKDGVTVAEEIELTDPYENMGAQLVKEAASKTSDAAGDGTTTATVLAQALVREGLRNVAAGANPFTLDSLGRSALHYAASLGHAACIAEVLAAYPGEVCFVCFGGGGGGGGARNK